MEHQARDWMDGQEEHREMFEAQHLILEYGKVTMLDIVFQSCVRSAKVQNHARKYIYLFVTRKKNASSCLLVLAPSCSISPFYGNEIAHIFIILTPNAIHPRP